MSGIKRIGLREVRALKPGEIIWDSAVAGFGARRQQGPGVTFFVKYRTAEGRQRWHKIGRHGAPWTPETAREEAKKVLGAKTPEDEAFINLVGGVGNNNEELFDSAAFFEQRKELGGTLFPESGVDAAAPGAGGERGEFYRNLTSEITAMQINTLLGERRPMEKPLFLNGLVPTRDGMHWAVPVAARV